MRTNTPKLRFKEFINEWQEKNLGELLVIGSGRGYSHLKKGDIPVYGTGGLMLHVNDFLYDGKSICIGRKGTIDKPQFLNGKFWTVDTLFYTYDYKRSLPEFLYLIFQKINWQKYNEASGVPSLSKTTIEKIKVFVPSESEQEKIADFLTAVDKKIAKLEGKKKGFEKYKKGAMQAIFSQKIRFRKPDGSNYPDWEEKKFDDVLVSLPTKSHQILNSQFNKQGKFPVVDQGQQKIAGYSDDSSRLFSNVPAIVFGDHTTFLKYISFAFIVGADGTKLLHARDGNDHKYLYYALEKNKLVPEGYKRHFSVLKMLILPIPIIEEQEKIAEFLTALDNKVDLINKELEQAKLFKNSLLQQMFV